MVLVYEIITVESITPCYLLNEIDENEDETIILESKYRNEILRVKNYLDKEQRQLTIGDDC